MREGTRAAILGRVDSMGETAPTPADLGVLTQPTLILWGEQDAVIPVSTATRLEAILPNTTTVIYPQLGHIPMEEAPELTASDVRQFLDSLEGSH
jgi:pimeloyl-ACP methyl ester carboxylesterase